MRESIVFRTGGTEFGLPEGGIRLIAACTSLLILVFGVTAPGGGRLASAQGIGSGEEGVASDGVGAEEPPAPRGERIYEAEDVVITGTRTPRALKDTPIKTEVIRSAQIERKGAVNLVEALAFEPGIRVDNQCSICNTYGIQLAGMPSRYTLLLIDGLPVYSSLGQTYGLSNISAADVEQIEIVKGANSILYGTDAVGGVVNVLTRRPTVEPQAQLLIEGGHFGYKRLSGAASGSRGPLGLSIVGSIASQDKVDRDGDGISEYAGYQRANFSGTARLELDTRTDMLVRLSYAQETRQGGGMGSFLEAINDFDPEEETGRRAISESIITDRIEAGARLSRVVNLRLRTETSLGLVQHDQDSDYAGEVYTARQHMLFVQQNAFVEAHDRYRVVSGASYRYEGLDENLALQEYHYHMPGFFAQGEYRPADWVEFIHGLRYDWHNIFGSVVTPRLALKVAPHQHLTLRTSLGTGFRAPTTFFEYIHGVRPEGYRLVNESVKPEESVGGNVSATLDAGPMARLTISGAYNRIANPITLDMLTDDDDEVYEVRVVNASEDLTVMSGEVQLQSNPTPWLRTALGYGLFHYDDPGEALLSAPPRQQFNVAMDAELRRLGLILSFNGELFSPMDLEGVYGEGYNARPGTALAGWLDESNADLDNPKRARSPWYGVLNVRAEKLLLGGLSAHVGVDNLLDYHQSDVEGPVFFSMGDDGRLEPADVAYVWGPLRGRFIYGGMKAKL